MVLIKNIVATFKGDHFLKAPTLHNPQQGCGQMHSRPPFAIAQQILSIQPSIQQVIFFHSHKEDLLLFFSL